MRKWHELDNSSNSTVLPIVLLVTQLEWRDLLLAVWRSEVLLHWNISKGFIEHDGHPGRREVKPSKQEMNKEGKYFLSQITHENRTNCSVKFNCGIFRFSGSTYGGAELDSNVFLSRRTDWRTGRLDWGEANALLPILKYHWGKLGYPEPQGGLVGGTDRAIKTTWQRPSECTENTLKDLFKVYCRN